MEPDDASAIDSYNNNNVLTRKQLGNNLTTTTTTTTGRMKISIPGFFCTRDFGMRVTDSLAVELLFLPVIIIIKTIIIVIIITIIIYSHFIYFIF